MIRVSKDSIDRKLAVIRGVSIPNAEWYYDPIQRFILADANTDCLNAFVSVDDRVLRKFMTDIQQKYPLGNGAYVLPEFSKMLHESQKERD